MKKIKNFVNNTFKDVDKENRKQVTDKVTESLIEKVEDLIESGLTEEEAINKTVLEFGTVEDYYNESIKKERKIRRQKTLRHYGNDLLFSGVGSAILIGILVYINLYFTPSILWSVIPSIGILYWPLAILYTLLNKKANKEEKDDE